jgi:hypothetical protein
MQCTLLHAVSHKSAWCIQLDRSMQWKLAQNVPEDGLCLQVNKMLLAGFGETFSEARASTLLQLPFHPRDLTEEEREGANITAIVLHGAVYSARPDVACVLHTHSPYATALAAADVEFNPEIMQVRCIAPFARHCITFSVLTSSLAGNRRFVPQSLVPVTVPTMYHYIILSMHGGFHLKKAQQDSRCH